MAKEFIVKDEIKIEDLRRFVFGENLEVNITEGTLARVSQAYLKLQSLLEKQIPIYGVTTGFGDSCFRVIPREKSEELQANLIAYLTCGTGPLLPKEASKAVLLIRLQSLCKGYSGVSLGLIDRMKLFLDRNWIPAIPREGSLGASGDLIPLAYLAQAFCGEGMLHGIDNNLVAAAEVMKEAGVKPYKLKVKEGIALVNGTSAMAGLALVNLNHAEFLLNLAAVSSSWLCLALSGKTEAFGTLVNEKAKKHPGQARVAKAIRNYLEDESYSPGRGQDVPIDGHQTQGLIQDRYSLRCVPQILGPVADTIEQGWQWLELEVNSASDNPLIGEDGNLEMGGNFYGGYLAHSMDYLKICLAHVGDLYDRQLAYLIDEKSNRGLTPNLADWSSLPENERHLHHGLKGLHQSVSALTSELLSQALPNSIFSRSSESHNQDKVSLGMTSAVKCNEMINTLYTIQSMYLICLTQALDLREITLKSEASSHFYKVVRQVVPMVKRDQPLGNQITQLSEVLKNMAANYRGPL